MTRSPGVPLRAVLALAVWALVPAIASAQGYDPRYRWRTLDTPHFQLHYHQGEERLAQRAAHAAERAHAVLAPLLGHVPEGRTQVILSDDTDDANGSATPLPYNTVRLYAVPPQSLSELNDYGDWVEDLVFHEYTHILHLDTVDGLPQVANRIFGKLFTPNGVAPSWLIEGEAVLHEGPPGYGRNHSALFDMYARAAVTESRVGGIDRISNPPLEWPLGHAYYLLGGEFLGFLAERYGPSAIAAFNRSEGASVWPYALDWQAEAQFGKSFDRLWAEFLESLRTRYAAQLAEVRRRPVTAARPLTARGAEVHHPRWSPDGAFVAYFDEGLDEAPGLRRASPEGEDLGRAARVEANGTFALCSTTEALVAESDVFREYEVYDDLYVVDLGTGARRRVTYGERATDPDLSPDRSSAVYVSRSGAGEHALRRVRLDGGAPETILARPGAQIFMPRVSRDGRIAFELQEGPRRDIVVWEAGRVTKVTDDDAIDVSPAWSPDGRTLFFASDRGGIYNLYAWDGVSLRQVTNVETGAFEPDVSPDGKALAFVTYSARGYDLAQIPVDPGAWLDPLRATPRPLPPSATAEPDYLSRPYRALDTALPTFWLPSFAFDAAGPSLGVITGGFDALVRHAWALDARYSFLGKDLDYSAAYRGGWSFPTLELASERFVGTAPGDSRYLESVWTPLALGLSFPRSHVDRSQTVSFAWSGTSFQHKDALAPPQFKDGFASQLSLGVSYGDERRFVRAISPEEGRALSLSIHYASRELGSDFTYASARMGVTQYLRVPATRHVVLALHATVGAGIGSLGGRAPFRLGGMPPPDLLGLVLGGAGGPVDVLRGYPAGAFAGSGLATGNVELRFPLLSPELGHSTWPLFLRRVHGALFLDAGEAFALDPSSEPNREPGGLERLRFGAGGELRLELVLGYYLRTDLRIGVARGLGTLLAPLTGRPAPADPQAETQVYVTLGESF